MSLGKRESKPPDKNRLRGYRQVALATTIPLIMLAAPAVGYFLGRYLDSLLGTAGIFMMVFLFLGVAAGGMEAYRIIKQIIKESDD